MSLRHRIVDFLRVFLLNEIRVVLSMVSPYLAILKCLLNLSCENLGESKGILLEIMSS